MALLVIPKIPKTFKCFFVKYLNLSVIKLMSISIIYYAIIM